MALLVSASGRWAVTRVGLALTGRLPWAARLGTTADQHPDLERALARFAGSAGLRVRRPG
ncbi:hypothetical protein A6A25_16660 [Saccharothrix sp. CB00851]|nr:hypothetical protein A6A25_16660 [Saccharothrix sp. CB00851]